LVLQSYGGRATLDQIQQVLVPDVIRDDWKKWWEVAKRELKKDGHFQIPTKKSEPVIYQVQEVSLDDRLLSEFRQVKGLRAKVAAAHEAIRSFPDVSDKNKVANEMTSVLNADIGTHQRTQPSTALEAIFARDELRVAAGLPETQGELTSGSIWAQESVKFAHLLEQIPAAKHRRTLQSFKESNPERWHEVVLANLNNLSSKLAGECASLLIHEGKLQQ